MSDALASYEKALSAEPRSAKIRWACARTLMELGDAARALANVEAAIGLDPKHGGAHNIRGLALTALGRRKEALASFDQALAINPEDAAALNNRGELLQGLGNVEAAIADLSKALALSPGLSFISGQLLHYRMRLSDWTDFNVQRDSLKTELAEGSVHCSPFALLSLVDEPELHRMAAKSYLTRRCPITSPPIPAHPRANKIRIGHFSADFLLMPPCT